MAVYVDNMKAPFGCMKMCRMIADTHDELVAMADQIGVARKWIQRAGTHQEPFDIGMSKLNLAGEARTIGIDRRAVYTVMQSKRLVAMAKGDPRIPRR